MRKKKCKACNEWFMPDRQFQEGCTIECAIKIVDKKRERKRKKETARRREGLKTKREWLDDAERAFRRYIRARDRAFYIKQGKLPECISCGTNDQSIQYAAGHFKTKGAYPELRLDEKNCYLQCNRRCNKELSGNINGTKDTYGYIDGLKKRFGEEEATKILDYLESPRPMPNWTIDDLKEIKNEYNKLALAIEKEIG